MASGDLDLEPGFLPVFDGDIYLLAICGVSS